MPLPRIPLLFSRLVTHFMPADRRQERSFDAYNQRLTLLLGLMVTAWSPVFAIQYLFVVDTIRLSLGFVVAMALGILLLYRFRSTGSLVALCHQACALTTLLLIWLCVHTGGINSPVIYWVLLPPIFAISILGRPAPGLAWTAISLGAFVALFAIPEFAWDITDQITDREHGVMMLLSSSGLMISVVIMFLLRNEMESWLLRTTREAEVQHREHEEEAGKRLRSTLVQLMDRSPTGVLMVTGDENTVLYANPSFDSLLGCSDEDVEVGLDLVGSLELNGLLDKAEDTQSVDGFLKRPDGEQVAVRTVAFRGVFDDLPVTILLLSDISKEQDIQTKMAEMDRMITTGTLAAGVAHEINNPLAFIATNVEYLLKVARREAYGEDLEEPLKDIHEGVRRVRKIVNDLLQLSRRNAVPDGVVDVNEVVDSTLSMVEHRARHRARLIRDAGDLPLGLFDGAAVGQIVLNFVINALQALPEGDPENQTILVRTREYDGEYYIDVQDSGPGIPDDVKERIFEPFFTTKAQGEGTGLGLAICWNLARTLGGRLYVVSALGEGTTFTLQWPRIAPTDDLPPIQLEEESSSFSEEPHPFQVVIIDDNELLRRALSRQLTRHGEVLSFGDAREALDALRDGLRPDIILCDLEMPGVSGRRFYELLGAELPELIPLVAFITGGVFTEGSQSFLNGCEAPVLKKPFAVDDVLRLVDGLRATEDTNL